MKMFEEEGGIQMQCFPTTHFVMPWNFMALD